MSINLVFSTDVGGLRHPPTVIASILRRTSAKVNVLIYTRGFSMESFCQGQLEVTFVRCDEPVSGAFPRHASSAAFNRMRILMEGPDWDRVLVMDHDMLLFCDLEEYFHYPFEDNLILGRLFSQPSTLGERIAESKEVPSSWNHVRDSPFFFMGPMMNLDAMRSESIWSTFLLAHEELNLCEHVSLAAACAGRIGRAPKKWNLVPQWDRLDLKAGFNGRVQDGEDPFHAIDWRNGIPLGLVHWTGNLKPWQYKSRAWNPDLWLSESTNWQALKLGLWKKPVVYLAGPYVTESDRIYLNRGFQTVRLTGRSSMDRDSAGLHPDHLVTSCLESPVDPNAFVRFEHGADLKEWKRLSQENLPSHIVVEGPRSPEEIDEFQQFGFHRELRVDRRTWPAGGPHPACMRFTCPIIPINLAADFDLYLTQTGHSGEDESLNKIDAGISGDSSTKPDWLARCGTLIPDNSVTRGGHIVVVGNPQLSAWIGEEFAAETVTCITEDWESIQETWLRQGSPSRVRFVHSPLCGSTNSHDLSSVTLEKIDGLVVSRPKSRPAASYHSVVTALAANLTPRGVVVIIEPSEISHSEALKTWQESDLTHVHAGSDFHLLTLPARPMFSNAAASTKKHRLADFVEQTYVISLPERTDRLADLRENWIPLGLTPVVLDGIRPTAEEIRWEEMREMEAYGKIANLRSDYVIGAVGCKRAGIRALETFLESRASNALICQDDCRWKPKADELIAMALRELPDYWDLLYFSASARLPHKARSPHLIKLSGARLCTAILWKRETAELLLQDLKRSGCEWDLFMQRAHSKLNAYCVHPMPAYQATSHSNIAHRMVKPANV